MHYLILASKCNQSFNQSIQSINLSECHQPKQKSVKLDFVVVFTLNNRQINVCAISTINS